MRALRGAAAGVGRRRCAALALACGAALLLGACRRGGGAGEPDVATAAWPEIERAARGQTVTWMMWMGDPYVNAYVRDFVAPRLLREHGVSLRTVNGVGNEIVTALMTEKESGRSVSELDLVWINGETFYQLRQLGVLFGPFTARLPNARRIDFGNPFIGIDFQQPIEGYECPWGNVQLAIIYDSARVKEPPRTRAALLAWVRAHPGRFTFDSAFTGMTLLKSWLIEIAGGGPALAGPFDPAQYERHAPELWAYVNALKPHLWKSGRTFPAAVAQLHQLFASGEVDFTMSNNDGEVDNKVLQGLFPDTARAYVFDAGTIQNSHFVGIPRHARHKAGALVTADFLVSQEAQYEKLKPAVWGDGSVLAGERLEAPWRRRFEDVPQRRFAPQRAEIQGRALRELAPEYMQRLYADFRREIVER